MTPNFLATGAAGVTAIGAAAAVITCATPMTPIAASVQPAVFGTPMPQEVPIRQAPASDLPSADELIGVLSKLADPDVPFVNKAGLVEGGIGPMEASVADKRLQKAAQRGQLPLSFEIADVEPTRPGTAATQVAISGPKLRPRTLDMTFVDQDGWKLSRSSAMALMQAAAEAG